VVVPLFGILQPAVVLIEEFAELCEELLPFQLFFLELYTATTHGADLKVVGFNLNACSEEHRTFLSYEANEKGPNRHDV
jgi:hypothetical protein